MTEQSLVSGFTSIPAFDGMYTATGKPMTAIQKQVGDALFAEKKVPCPVGCVDTNGKPIFDATRPFQHAVSEREMNDHSKQIWKTYSLWRTSLKVERRDSVYEAFTSGEYSNYSAAHHFLGTPFPIIEQHPHIYELCVAIRWYEHLVSGAIVAAFYNYMRTKPALRYGHLNMTSQRGFIFFMYCFTECMFAERAWLRLQGRIENEAECHKFGVQETKARLEKKVEYWKRYGAYKEEWMRRWDYHVWGMRPGERFGFWSPCHFAPYPPMFCEKTDFPMRKNPFLLSAKPLSEFKLEPLNSHWYPIYSEDSVTEGHPELKYLWRRGWNV